MYTVEIDGEAVLLDERENRLHHLNHTATLLWACFDGRATVRDLAVEISDELDTPYETVLDDTLAIVRHLGAEGSARRCPDRAGDRRRDRDALSPPPRRALAPFARRRGPAPRRVGTSRSRSPAPGLRSGSCSPSGGRSTTSSRCSSSSTPPSRRPWPPTSGPCSTPRHRGGGGARLTRAGRHVLRQIRSSSACESTSISIAVARWSASGLAGGVGDVVVVRHAEQVDGSALTVHARQPLGERFSPASRGPTSVPRRTSSLSVNVARNASGVGEHDLLHVAPFHRDARGRRRGSARRDRPAAMRRQVETRVPRPRRPSATVAGVAGHRRDPRRVDDDVELELGAAAASRMAAPSGERHWLAVHTTRKWPPTRSRSRPRLEPIPEVPGAGIAHDVHPVRRRPVERRGDAGPAGERSASSPAPGRSATPRARRPRRARGRG